MGALQTSLFLLSFLRVSLLTSEVEQIVKGGEEKREKKIALS